MKALPITLFLLLSTTVDAAAEPALGRIFYSAAERTMLDLAVRGESVTGPSEARPTALQATDPLHYGGLVRRSDGPTTGFVDGRPIGPATAGGRDVRLDGDRLLVNGPGGSSHLKPGERYLVGSPVAQEAADSRP